MHDCRDGNGQAGVSANNAHSQARTLLPDQVNIAHEASGSVGERAEVGIECYFALAESATSGSTRLSFLSLTIIFFWCYRKEANVIDEQFVLDFGTAINECERLAQLGEIVAVVLTSLKKSGFCHGADVASVVCVGA